jgi:hypothetical protein
MQSRATRTCDGGGQEREGSSGEGASEAVGVGEDGAGDNMWAGQEKKTRARRRDVARSGEPATTSKSRGTSWTGGQCGAGAPEVRAEAGNGHSAAACRATWCSRRADGAGQAKGRRRVGAAADEERQTAVADEAQRGG